MIQIDDFKNRKTIIVGETNTGKTALTGKILEMFLVERDSNLAIIDMAPERLKGIGGKLPLKTIGCARYYTDRIVPPRLTGKTDHEVETLAWENAVILERIIENCLINPPEVLFINDVSIYLQAGDLQKLLLLIDTVPTVIMNGYYGLSLGGGKLGEREHQNMEFLQDACDIVIFLKPRKNTSLISRAMG